MTRPSFLIVAYDLLGPLHAGPAVRTLGLAGELAKLGSVHIVYSGEEPSGISENVAFIPIEKFNRSKATFDQYSAAIVPPLIAFTLPEILDSDIPLVVDLFDPVIWENLDLYGNRPKPEQEFQHERHLAALTASMLRGDYFLAAGERQQDLFTGALMLLNRINPLTYKPGEGPEQMVGLVPFGLPSTTPPSPDMVKVPDVYKNNSPIIVWGGGLWDWLRPELPVSAMPKILEIYPDARLVFPGTRHPNPHIPEPESLKRVKQLAKNLGIEKSLIYGSWLPRDEYIGLLTVATCGVSAHNPGLETRYAVRTRFLDAFWTGLPMVVSGGDEYSALISQYGLGKVIDSNVPDEFADAIIDIIKKGRGSFSGNFDRIRINHTWEKTSRPLVEWLKSPRLTHGKGASFFHDTLGETSPRTRPNDLGSLMTRVLSRLKNK